MTSEVADFLDDINEMLENSRYDWARVTLKGIHDSVKQQANWVSDRQREAIRNIRGNNRTLLPSDKFRGGRRYEGWEPPR